MNILELTPAAIRVISLTLGDDPLVQGKSLRIGVKGGGCSGYTWVMDFDNPDPDDCIINNYPEFNICIDPHSASLVKGTVIDYSSNVWGGEFKFLNPQATTTCGCGKSWG